jgi:2'-hydroxyisoflavone reductase
MKLLVLGGTKFLGRAVVDAARARGHTLTLFNRGLEDPSAYPDVEQIHGDRTTAEGRARLEGRTWDAAIDTAAYLPRDVRSMASVVDVAHYTFVSSISVMAGHAIVGQDETAPVARLTSEQQAEVESLSLDGPIPARALGEFYGPLKAQCEETALETFPGAALIVRPGLIVGPFDVSDRFTYWPARFLKGGDVLAPGRPERRVMFIDVRDLAEWMVRMVEARASGTYLATGPAERLSFGTVLDACARVAAERGAKPSRLVWVDDAFLVAQGLGPWMEMPLWIPATDETMAGFMTENLDKALAAGLTFRPLEDTIRATLDWDAPRPKDAPRAAGIAPERERQLLVSSGKVAASG